MSQRGCVGVMVGVTARTLSGRHSSTTHVFRVPSIISSVMRMGVPVSTQKSKKRKMLGCRSPLSTSTSSLNCARTRLLIFSVCSRQGNGVFSDRRALPSLSRPAHNHTRSSIQATEVASIASMALYTVL